MRRTTPAGRRPSPSRPGSSARPRRGVAAAAAATLGLGLAIPSGGRTVALAAIVLGIGYGYDRFAKGTAWSWLPFAVGIPLLPVYGWLGAVGELPAFFAVLVPVAMLAGAALAIANAAADHERDTAAGVDSIVRRLGPAGAWRLHGLLFVVVIAAALATLVATGAQPVALAGAGLGGVVILLGVGLARDGGPERRQRAWEVEAIGSAVLAVAWVAGVTALRNAGVG